MLFAGRICGGREKPDSTRWPNCPLGINVGYSQGVRQLMHYHHWNRTGFKVHVSNPTYLEVNACSLQTWFLRLGYIQGSLV